MSASAPFVAGIAAMGKAINPALTSDQVRDLLPDSAWTDGNVSHYVNAYKAVRRASNGVLPHDHGGASECSRAVMMAALTRLWPTGF
jgi:hypothetical protein